MAPGRWGVHYQDVAWRRGERAQGEPERQNPGLFVEFDDDSDDGSEEDAVVAAPEVVSTPPASRWSRIPLRHRVTGVAVVSALLVGSTVGIRLAQAAQRRARERFTLAVVSDRYQPMISEVGLDMSLTLVNHGPALVTALFVEVSQPGLKLSFYPLRIQLPVGKPIALTLVGVFDCGGVAAAPADVVTSAGSTAEVTVNSQTGIKSVPVELEAGSVPPAGWQNQRSEFCAESSASS